MRCILTFSVAADVAEGTLKCIDAVEILEIHRLGIAHLGCGLDDLVLHSRWSKVAVRGDLERPVVSVGIRRAIDLAVIRLDL